MPVELAIFSTIEGYGDSYPIAECYNASRGFKYIAIRGHRYSSYNLVDMRIHDINLVADLIAPEPPQGEKPVSIVYDGTKTTQTAQSTLMVEDFFETAHDYVQIYWTGWWPTLHLRFAYYHKPDIELVLHFTIDIIGSFSIDPETVINLLDPILLNYGVKNVQNADAAYDSAMEDISDYLFGTGGIPWRVAWAAGLLMKLAALVVDSGQWGAALFASTALVFCTAMIVGAAQVVQDAIDGVLHPLAAAIILAINALAIAVDGFAKLFNSASKDQELNKLQKAGNVLTDSNI